MTPHASPAFPGEPQLFPDSRTVMERERDRREIEKQAAHLTDFPFDKKRQKRVLKRLNKVRKARGLPPIVKLPINDNVPALVPREFVVLRVDSDRADVRAVIKRFGMTDEPVELMDVELMRLKLPPRRLTLRPRALMLQLRGRCPAVADAIRALPIEPNYVVPLGGWIKGVGGPESTAARPALRPRWTAAIRVAVIDTGLGPRTDEWLQNLINPELDDLYPDPAMSKRGKPPVLGLAGGHGSFVAGIVQQVEPSTDLRMYRAADFDGIGDDTAVAEKIVQAANDGAKIINLSLGTQTVDDVPPLAIKTAIERAIAINGKILIVCAAGNYGDTRKVWPAAFSLTFRENVVAVAGLNAKGERRLPDWSTHDDPDKPVDDPGNFVGISTIAEGIVSTYVRGTEDRVVDDPPDVFGDNPFALWIGTSFAAPQITGAVARICLVEQVEPTEAIEMLKARGTVIPGYGRGVALLKGT